MAHRGKIDKRLEDHRPAIRAEPIGEEREKELRKADVESGRINRTPLAFTYRHRSHSLFN